MRPGGNAQGIRYCRTSPVEWAICLGRALRCKPSALTGLFGPCPGGLARVVVIVVGPPIATVLGWGRAGSNPSPRRYPAVMAPVAWERPLRRSKTRRILAVLGCRVPQHRRSAGDRTSACWFPRLTNPWPDRFGVLTGDGHTYRVTRLTVRKFARPLGTAAYYGTPASLWADPTYRIPGVPTSQETSVHARQGYREAVRGLAPSR